jgi:hypothetical protein
MEIYRFAEFGRLGFGLSYSWVLLGEAGRHNCSKP